MVATRSKPQQVASTPPRPATKQRKNPRAVGRPRRSRPDPYDEPEAHRPNIKKRGAPPQSASDDDEDPAETRNTNKRARVSKANASRADSSKPNAVVLAIMNQKVQAKQAPQPRHELIVPLRRSNARESRSYVPTPQEAPQEEEMFVEQEQEQEQADAIEVEGSQPESEDEEEQLALQFQDEMQHFSDQLDQGDVAVDEADEEARDEEAGEEREEESDEVAVAEVNVEAGQDAGEEADEDVDEEADVEQQQPTRSGRVPPRSGQGDRPPVATQQEVPSSLPINRQRPKQRPKQTFLERMPQGPGTQGPYISVQLEPMSSSPVQERRRRSTQRASQPGPSRQRGAAKNPSLSAEQLRRMGVGVRSPPRPNPTQQQAVPFDGDSSEEDEEEEVGVEEELNAIEDESVVSEDELEEPAGQAAGRDSLSHPAPSTTQGQDTVAVKGKNVIDMLKLMGMPGWTDFGKDWAKKLLRRKDSEPATSSGESIIKCIILLRGRYGTAPTARRLEDQNHFLLEHRGVTRKALKKLDKDVDDIYSTYKHHTTQDLTREQQQELRSLRSDLIDWVLPLLILLLQEFILLGDYHSEDVNSARALPTKRGVFTSTTLDFLVRTSGWISRLASIVKHDTNSTYNIAALRQIITQSDAFSDSLPQRKQLALANQRLKLFDLAREFRQAVKNALTELEDKAEKRAEEEARRQKRAERAEKIRSMMEEAEREKEQKRMRHLEVMALDAQRAREEPYAGVDPYAVKWLKRQDEDRRREEEWAREQDEKERREAERERERQRGGSPELDSGVFSSPARQDRRSGKQPALEELEYTGRIWTVEEIVWLGDRLEETGAGRPDWDSWAEALECTVDDVWVEGQRQKALMRYLAEKKGKRAPDWALAR